MRNLHKLFWISVGAFLLPAGAAAQYPLHWQPTLESAKQLAAQTDRLVLIHFWADWCQVCRKMEQEVFSQPGVASAVQASYVPVKINADYFPTTRKRYGVTALPTDIIITPQGAQIDRLEGVTAASQYVARLNQTAAAVKAQRVGPYARISAASPLAAANRVGPPQNTAGAHPPDTPKPPDERYAGYYNRQRQAPAALVRPQQAIASPAIAGPGLQRPSVRPASDNPPLGLDGYCPVQLSDDMNANLQRWTLGDRRWGVIHRGRTYLFAGPAQQQRFLADPDRYAPVISGNDAVMAVDYGQTVPGHREHGAFFGNRVYLFANEASYEKFSKNPSHYVNQVLQAMQAGSGTPGRSVY